MSALARGASSSAKDPAGPWNASNIEREDLVRARRGVQLADDTHTLHRDGEAAITAPGMKDSLPDRDLAAQYEDWASKDETRALSRTLPLATAPGSSKVALTDVVEGSEAVERMKSHPSWSALGPGAETIEGAEKLQKKIVTEGVETALPTPRSAGSFFPGTARNLTDYRGDAAAIVSYDAPGGDASEGAFNVNAGPYVTMEEATKATAATLERDMPERVGVGGLNVVVEGCDIPYYPTRVAPGVTGRTSSGTWGELGECAMTREDNPAILHGDGIYRLDPDV